MDNISRRDAGILYISDEAVYEEQKRARRLTQKLNTMDRSDFDAIAAVIRELFGRGEGAMVNPPFYCDYGDHIFVGRNFFANYNCCFLDVGKITFGDNCLLGPNVCITTAGHPVHPAARNTLYEYGIDVTVGNNVWIGANAVLCPGVTIGDNAVIGAGSVVTRDIPAWTVAAGSPCRVIRRITEADRELYFRGVRADDEALAHMRALWDAGDELRYPSAPESE
ncbi:MAG: sugar O-acetyltransferase [Oscillospiraceae bacterium]|nr:sugar O-acetyltransferase [Oscillospiraceae bacterium]